MPRSRSDAQDRSRLGTARVLRVAAVALVLATAACCPAPLTATSDTPTAFAAVVVEVDATSWVAEGPGGVRHRIDGFAPASPGSRVYVSGTLAADGSLVLSRADPLSVR